MIEGSRLKQAREVKGWTQEFLAETTGVPQPTISLIESGNFIITPGEMIRMANKLDVPVKFFLRSPVELPEGSLGLFRSLKSKVKSHEYKSSRRLAEIGVESILRLGQDIRIPSVRIEQIPNVIPELAAQHARSMLRIAPDEPIVNLTFAMERSGVFVLRISNISEHITGFSAWIDPIPGLSSSERPIVVTRRPLTAFRLRFTLAHELGHLILGHEVFTGPLKPIERDANLFAQALLMPTDSAYEDLGVQNLNVDRLLELKRKWGMSMHALAMRAKFLGIIDESKYRSIHETLRLKGYLKREPGDLKTPPEQPRLLLELAKQKGVGISAYDVASRLDLGLGHVRQILGDETDEDFSNFNEKSSQR